MLFHGKCLFFSALLAFLLASSSHGKKPEALSGFNSIGDELGPDPHPVGGSSWSQVWTGGRHPTSHGPSFIGGTDEVTSTVGGNAFLPCSVQQLGDRTVTWLRQRDLHILTAGAFTYSADERFRVLHPDNSPDWTLHIKMVTPNDAGLYECQVNSDPKISRTVTLTVKEKTLLDDPGSFVTSTNPQSSDYWFGEYEDILFDLDIDWADEKKRKSHQKLREICLSLDNRGRYGHNLGPAPAPPAVHIEGAEARYIQEGSILALTCLVTHNGHRAPKHLLWFRGSELLDYNSPRGGVSVQTEKMSSRTVSRLMISGVKVTVDSGQYSCSPTDLPTAVVTVDVQKGEHQAAVQQSVYSSATRGAVGSLLCVSLLFSLIYSYCGGTNHCFRIE